MLALASAPAFGLVFALALALALAPRPAPAAQERPRPSSPPSPIVIVAPRAPTPDPRFTALPALLIENQTTRERRELKLYDAFGAIDEQAATALDALLCDARKPKQRATTRIDRRTLQLLFKAAYHFRSYEVEVVSAYRKPGRRREGPHGQGSAIDFRLRGVSAKELASYLRDIPRTGVGIYTHPKTQYVHLDSREHSFHWLDASPPRRHWREKSIGGKELVKRDAEYRPASDLPL
ncbi:MAG: hypothetical protein K0R38_5301 [Polyangiaceae bacterium]|nr:hypothetical protein [Polyangiaceae bacterium]